MGCTFFSVKYGNAFCFSVNQPDGGIIQYKCQSIFDFKNKICLIFPGRHRKYIFTQDSFCLQGILNNINEQEKSFLHCKDKHMMKRGAPPDKVGILGPLNRTWEIIILKQDVTRKQTS